MKNKWLMIVAVLFYVLLKNGNAIEKLKRLAEKELLKIQDLTD
jgi:hypothetical protein